MGEVTFKILRFNPEKDRKPHFETYPLETTSGLTVLEGLNEIYGYQDGSLTYRRSCRSAICGSCVMRISGTNLLACKTQVRDVTTGGIVTVEPLPYLKIIKDLVVDRTPFWHSYEAIKPWLVTNGTPPPEKENRIDPSYVVALHDAETCIQCGACYSACPIVALDPKYLGPAALLKAFRFEMDPRDHGTVDRMRVLDNLHGLWRCHTVYNCIDACPKNLNPTFAIEELRKQVMARRVPWLSWLKR
jgi:succinate dehydrogenase / fumarate reductase, iron-sulfur subunit